MTYRLKITRTNGREYAAIVEDLYDPKRRGSVPRTLKAYGDLVKLRLSNSKIDEQIQEELNRLNADSQMAEKLWTKRYSSQLGSDLDYEAMKTLDIGGLFYQKIWESLGLSNWLSQAKRNTRGKISFDLNLAAFLLASGRILNPQSKKRTFLGTSDSIIDFSDLTLQNLYDTLSFLASRKDTLISNINKQIKSIFDRVQTIAFYDCTTFYFESFDSDELRARGMSKDNKTNEVQVVMGLLIDADGIPINYQLFRGNTSEMHTMIEVVKAYKEQAGLEGITVVADRGLNSGFNLKQLRADKFHYIVAQSIHRLNARLRARVFDENWDEVWSSSESDDIFKIKRIKEASQEGLDNEIIVTWSKKRAAHDLKVLEERYSKCKEMLEKGDSAVDASFKHGSRQFLVRNKQKNTKAKAFKLNETLYERRVKEAGFYALVSSKKDSSSSEIYGDLRQLWKIESCFRVLKSNLDARPVFVWTPEHIRGHFVICYLALVMQQISHLIAERKGLCYSSQEIIEVLQGAKVLAVDQKSSTKTLYLRVPPGGDKQANRIAREKVDSLLALVGIPKIDAYETRASLGKKAALGQRFKLRN